MIDEQLDIFGGSTMVTRKRNRPAPAADPAVQMALFATDAGELAGQAVATDELGALVADEPAAPATRGPITAAHIAELRAANHGVTSVALVWSRTLPGDGYAVVTTVEAYRKGYRRIVEQTELVDAWCGDSDATVAADLNIDRERELAA